MKKIVLLATLSICSLIYSSESSISLLSYKEEQQKRLLPSKIVIKKALFDAGHRNIAQRDTLMTTSAHQIFSHKTVESILINTLFLEKDFNRRNTQEASIIIFKTGTPVENAKL